MVVHGHAGGCECVPAAEQRSHFRPGEDDCEQGEVCARAGAGGGVREDGRWEIENWTIEEEMALD